MIRSKYILLAAATMTLASCSNDIDPAGVERLPDSKYPLNITATLERMNTRAGSEKSVFMQGDAIGVRIGDAAETGKYTVDENGALAATTPLYWQTSAEATVTAWYPCDVTEVDLSDQSDENFTPVDFLLAGTTASYIDNPLKLTFTHRMAKVKYELKNEAGISETEWRNVKVKIYGFTSVCSDVAGNLTGSAEGWIIPGKTDTWLYPQDMTGKPLFRVSAAINGQNRIFTYTPTEETDGNITAGNNHTYTITVKRDRIEVQVETGGQWTYGGDENVGSKEVVATYTADQLKPGDYFYRTNDGTWATSDGGLRAVYADDTVRVEDVPLNPEKGTCIGIVFRAGKDASDYGEYPESMAGEFHGYVMALTDVNQNDNDRLIWGYKNGQYSMNAGTSTEQNDWNGYSNQKAIENFAQTNTDGWEMKDFEAAYWCSCYGTEYSRYNWQQRYTAPANTSGWFLPSGGQLISIYSVNITFADLLKNRIEKVKPLDTDNIKWFSTSWYYWSSSESSESNARYVGFSRGYAGAYLKSRTNSVRAVLAF